MDHKQWLEYEEKCIQEQPPGCATACPMHMDIRSFVAQLKDGNFNKAFEVFRRSVPFAGIIGRICDHPCETSCKRGEIGDPVAIGLLERASVEFNTASSMRVTRPSKTGKRVAVIGSGLSSLSASFSLAGRGHSVVLFEATDCLGGSLWDIVEDILPRDVISYETGILSLLGVETRFHTKLGETLSIENLEKDFDAIYLGIGNYASREFNLSRDFDLDVGADGCVIVDPITFETSRKGVFAGGSMLAGRNDSPITAVADGKRAAVSIDRLMQGVSLTAIREKEGPYPTTLYTKTDGIKPLVAVKPDYPEQGYSREEVIMEAARCIDCQCMECVKSCEYLAHYKAYPKKYARQINQNLHIVMGIHGANNLINSCNLCGLCKEVCPTDFDMPKLIREARLEMVQHEKMPPSAHDFPLQEMEFSNGEQCSLTRNEPQFSSSKFVLFPGCQLSGSKPEYVQEVYSYLRGRLQGGVGLMLRCCGAPAEWAGQSEQFRAGLQSIKDQWEILGYPNFILPCSSCYQTFKNHLPEIATVSLWEIYSQLGLPGADRGLSPAKISVHDSCTTRYETEIHESVRDILRQLGIEIEELENSREKTECCGFGGLQMYANRQVSDASIRRRISENGTDYVAYCAMCRDNFSAKGKKTYHILDFIYGKADSTAPVTRGPTYTQSRENKAWLKSQLLDEIWGETTMELESPHKSIKLVIPTEIIQVLEERLISEEDIQKVIEHAETTGEKVVNQSNGHVLASYRPVQVTFWVEYTSQHERYVIHNAYSHRMVVEGNS